MAQYADFIPQNVAPKTAKRIGVYNENGERLFSIPIGHLAFRPAGDKLYSFGAISDVHLQYGDAPKDFPRALQYLNDAEKVAFTCVCGDLTGEGTNDQLAQYKQYVDTYSPNTPVYSIAGNHECWTDDIEHRIEAYTGKPLYYSFTHGNDVFIMVGLANDDEGNLFAEGELQWLYETLEANRNKRCFVFQHVRPQDGCGNAYGIYAYDIWGGTEAEVFESLMSHYHNVILFHGHSHLRFGLQTATNKANYDSIFGCHSVHIPSIYSPRTGDSTGPGSREDLTAESEGYVVDVYKNGIHLKGRDFEREEFLPIATYWLDTTLQIIPAGTYIDSTGTIVTK